jgi:chromosome segregation ATPase
MKNILLVLFVILFAGTLWSESVTEVAKKEKARREAIAKQGKKAKVLTNKDVANIKSSLGIESTGAAGTESNVDPTAEPAVQAIQQATDEADSGLEELMQQRDELTGKVQELSETINQGGAQASNIGERYKEKRVTEEELENVEKQIQAIEQKRKAAAEKAESQKPAETQKPEEPQPESQPQ